MSNRYRTSTVWIRFVHTRFQRTGPFFLTIWGQIIDSRLVDPGLRRRCLRALRKTCGLYGILPDSHTVAYPLSRPGPRAVASGGFGDVWRLIDETNDIAYAVKSLRVYEQDPVEKINKVWSSLQVYLNRGVDLRPLGIEILQGSDRLQASESSKYFVD